MAVRSWRGLVYTVVGATALLLYVSRVKEVCAAALEPYGRFTAAQIGARTQRLFDLRAPDTSGVRMEMERIVTGSLTGVQRRHWVVDAVDGMGTYAGYHDWDADTGELLSASYATPAKAEKGLSELGSRQAISVSWSWLRRLGVAQTALRWRPLGLPDRGVEAWRVYWRAKDRTVVTVIHTRSGELLSFMLSSSR